MPFGDGKHGSDGDVPGRALVKAGLLLVALTVLFLAWLHATGRG